MFLSIIEMVLPVILMFLLGWLCKQKNIFQPSGLTGIKALVSNVLLPVVLFNAFFTAEYSSSIVVTFLTVYFSCALGLLAGFFLRKLVKPHDQFFPFLVTNFEGGMLGYALFGLLYAGQTRIFAMVDIGQTLGAYTFFMVALKSVGGGKSKPRDLLMALYNPSFIGTVLGVILGVTGISKFLLSSPVGSLISSSISFISAPVSGLILIIVGYELSFRRELFIPVFKTILLRLAVMLVLLILGRIIIFTFIPFNKPQFVALLLAYSLPAPFIIPLYTNVGKEGEYISTVLSIETVFSILLFAGIAAYSLA